MARSWIGAILAISSLGGLFAAGAFAHPASGIVVNAKGDVYFVHTGRGVGKIDAEGRLTYIHEVGGGGHFLALDAEGRFSTQFPRLFEKLMPEGAKPTLLYASGGGPLIVNRDGNLYYGSGYPEGDDLAPGFLTVTRLSPDGKRSLFAPALKMTLEDMNEGVTGLTAGPDGSLFVACPNAIVKVTTDGTVTTLVHPVIVKDRDDDLAKGSRTQRFSLSLFEGHRCHGRRDGLCGRHRLSLRREDHAGGRRRDRPEGGEALDTDRSRGAGQGRVRAGVYKP